MISCICPTYNRVATKPELLNEAVQSFLLQDYKDKELIIINDHPKQEIIFEHPQVKVINCKERFKTLGEKYNYAIEQASGDFICSWEDDDISLPHRLSYSVGRIGNNDYFNPKAYYFLSGGKKTFDQQGYAHNCSIFRKSAWKKVGGYPALSGPQDAAMDGLLRQNCSVIDGLINKEDCFFIYRWGVSELHLSAYKDTQKVYDEYEERAKKEGIFKIEPRWNIDYKI